MHYSTIPVGIIPLHWYRRTVLWYLAEIRSNMVSPAPKFLDTILAGRILEIFDVLRTIAKQTVGYCSQVKKQQYPTTSIQILFI